jgi:hypothetical protein
MAGGHKKQFTPHSDCTNRDKITSTNIDAKKVKTAAI